jgi:hypothetical protein
MPAQAGIQYYAPVEIREIGNTGSSAFADDDSASLVQVLFDPLDPARYDIVDYPQ